MIYMFLFVLKPHRLWYIYYNFNFKLNINKHFDIRFNAICVKISLDPTLQLS